jgi:hypothetical protein
MVVCNGNRLFFDEPAARPTVPGVPVPDCDEHREWWYEQYHRNPETTLNLLAQCERLGLKWVSSFFDLLVEECS